MVSTPAALGRFCDWDCLLNWTKENPVKMKKAYNKQVSKEHQEMKANTSKTRIKAAKTACHLYIRVRDQHKGCISCGKALVLGKFDAGHFMESGNFSFTRYHELNIHGQCTECNRFKGARLNEYEKNLRLKLGDEKVDWIHANKNKVTKRTIEDYRDIEKHYKNMLKTLQSNTD